MPIPHALSAIAPTTIVWVDPDELNRQRVIKSLETTEVELDFTATGSLLDALLLVGQIQPNLLIIDGRVDDGDRDGAVRAIQARYPEVGVVYIDHELTENERRAAAALKVLAMRQRDEDPAAVIASIARQ